MSHRLDGYLAPQTGVGVNGHNTDINAQSATGTGSTGGNLVLSSGSGIVASGNVYVNVGGVTKILATDTMTVLTADLLGLVTAYLTFDGYQINPMLSQADQPIDGINGSSLIIKAQDSVNDFAYGGDLILRSGDGYSDDSFIRDGYVRIYSGSIEQARAVPNKFYMVTGQRVNLTDVSSTPFDVMEDQNVLLVDTSTLAITINLPANPIRGDKYTIKDAVGNAGAQTITVSGNGYDVDANPSATISTNFGSVTVVFNDTNSLWNII